MKKYMTIGAVVGTMITAERLIRKSDDLFSSEDLTDPGFWIGAAIGAVINAVIWPASLACEIVNIANGI